MRRLINIAAVCSLLCCIALGTLLVRSYYIRDFLSVCHVNSQASGDIVHYWCMKSARGGLKVEHDISTYVSGEGAKMPWWHRDTSDPTFYPFFGTLSTVPGRNHFTIWQQAGFDVCASSTGTPPAITRGFILPLWFVVPLFLILPVLRFRTYLREKSPNANNHIGRDVSIGMNRQIASVG